MDRPCSGNGYGEEEGVPRADAKYFGPIDMRSGAGSWSKDDGGVGGTGCRVGHLPGLCIGGRLRLKAGCSREQGSRQTGSEAGRQTDREAGRPADRQTGRPASRQTGSEAGRKTGCQSNGQVS